MMDGNGHVIVTGGQIIEGRDLEWGIDKLVDIGGYGGTLNCRIGYKRCRTWCRTPDRASRWTGIERAEGIGRDGGGRLTEIVGKVF